MASTLVLSVYLIDLQRNDDVLFKSVGAYKRRCS